MHGCTAVCASPLCCPGSSDRSPPPPSSCPIIVDLLPAVTVSLWQPSTPDSTALALARHLSLGFGGSFRQACGCPVLATAECARKTGGCLSDMERQRNPTEAGGKRATKDQITSPTSRGFSCSTATAESCLAPYKSIARKPSVGRRAQPQSRAVSAARQQPELSLPLSWELGETFPPSPRRKMSSG